MGCTASRPLPLPIPLPTTDLSSLDAYHGTFTALSYPSPVKRGQHIWPEPQDPCISDTVDSKPARAGGGAIRQRRERGEV